MTSGDLKHTFEDAVRGTESLAKQVQAKADQKFHDEVYAKLPPTAQKDLSKVGHQAELFGEGVVSGAVLNPINGITQLSNALIGTHLPDLKFSNQEEVDKSLAGKIGKMAGGAADFALTAGTVGAVADVASTSMTALAAAGALQAGVFTPTASPKSTGDLLKSRAEGAVEAAGTGAIMGGLAPKIEGVLGKTELNELSVKMASSVIAGSVGGATRAEATSMLQSGKPAPAKAVGEQALGGAAGAAAARVVTTINPEITDSIGGRMANGTVAATTGGAAGNAAGQTEIAKQVQKTKDSKTSKPAA